MRSVGLVPSLALLAGVVGGIQLPLEPALALFTAGAAAVAAGVAWRAARGRLVVGLLVIGFAAAGVALGGDARETALHPSLREVMHEAIGGVRLDTVGPEGDHDPMPLLGRLREDAARFEGYTSLRVATMAVRPHGTWVDVDGGVTVSVSGEAAAAGAGQWRRGRIVELPVTFRRPARFVDDGVADFERQAALGGTALLASTKSGLLVEVVQVGSWIDELAGEARAYVREAVARRVGQHDPLSAAIVTAILIGDRTGLPDPVRDRLQAAGTYHVLAISGGNIAILAGLVLASLAGVGIRGRCAAMVAAALLLAYAQIVTAGPSVWRATLMATLYLAARAIDLRTAPWQSAAMAAASMAVARPLDVLDAGFALTFGATAALVEAATRLSARSSRLASGARVLATKARTHEASWLQSKSLETLKAVAERPVRWLIGSLVASAAVELFVLPVTAQTFSQVTAAGLVLNLVAVPAMALVQIAGMAALVPDAMASVASAAGWVAHAGAVLLVASSRLVEIAPWLAARVPAPGIGLVALYYVALLTALYATRPRARRAGMVATMAIVLIAAGVMRGRSSAPRPPDLQLTMFDVGQGESMLLRGPTGRTLMIDAAGAPFGASLDIGPRVLAPALWARGVHSLDALLLTHGDPDHIGGATTLVDVFRPRRLWEGVVVPRHEASARVRAHAATRGATTSLLRAGHEWVWDNTTIRVLHPPEPDWERPRIRNDDSVVLELRYGDVALLLTGDVGHEVERAILPQLTPARWRVLKVGHHGSRTSTSMALLEAWRPQLALISAGRGNSFGHPTADVLRRLEAIGTTTLRTDLHGQITIETDGKTLRWDTFQN
jgi:competence protein ComEC